MKCHKLLLLLLSCTLTFSGCSLLNRGDSSTEALVSFDPMSEYQNVYSVSINKGEHVEAPKDPVKEGAKFINWSNNDNGEIYNENTTIGKDTTFTANYQTYSYTTTRVSGNSFVNSNEYLKFNTQSDTILLVNDLFIAGNPSPEKVNGEKYLLFPLSETTSFANVVYVYLSMEAIFYYLNDTTKLECKTFDYEVKNYHINQKITIEVICSENSFCGRVISLEDWDNSELYINADNTFFNMEANTFVQKPISTNIGKESIETTSNDETVACYDPISDILYSINPGKTVITIFYKYDSSINVEITVKVVNENPPVQYDEPTTISNPGLEEIISDTNYGYNKYLFSAYIKGFGMKGIDDYLPEQYKTDLVLTDGTNDLIAHELYSTGSFVWDSTNNVHTGIRNFDCDSYLPADLSIGDFITVLVIKETYLGNDVITGFFKERISKVEDKDDSEIKIEGISSIALNTYQLFTATGVIESLTETVVWSVSDTSIAVVDSLGYVFGKKEGTFVLTAEANGKTGYITIEVIVLENVISIGLYQESYEENFYSIYGSKDRKYETENITVSLFNIAEVTNQYVKFNSDSQLGIFLHGVSAVKISFSFPPNMDYEFDTYGYFDANCLLLTREGDTFSCPESEQTFDMFGIGQPDNFCISGVNITLA